MKDIAGFLKISISDKAMSKLMYAVLITKSKIVNVHHLGIDQYSRKQNSGHCVDVVIQLDPAKLDDFQKLSGFALKTSKEFQGEMKVN